MVSEILYWLFGIPGMACLQSLFAVLMPAKTWQIRRLQSYVLLATGSGLCFAIMAGLAIWLRGSWTIILVSAAVGYVLLLIGGALGRRVEEASKTASQHGDGKGPERHAE